METSEEENIHNAYEKGKAEVIDAIKPLITKNGIRVDGIGILPGKFDKLIEVEDKIQKFNFFIEARQKRMEETQNKILQVLKEIKEKLK